MHEPVQFDSSGSKFSKIAVVALMHVGLVGALLSMKVVIEHKPETPSGPVFPRKEFVPEPQDTVTPPEVTTAPPPAITPPVMPIVDVTTPTEPTITVERGEPAKTDTVTPVVTGGTVGGTGTTAALEPAKPPRIYQAALADANACALPSYPAQSARNGDTGTVTLALLIGADGKVGASRIQRSSGHPELDRAAVAALKLCAFKPAATNGVPEAAWGQIAYVWTLD